MLFYIQLFPSLDFLEQVCGIYIKEFPIEVLVNDIYLSNVKTFESLSESTIQLDLNGTVMKEFGIERST